MNECDLPVKPLLSSHTGKNPPTDQIRSDNVSCAWRGSERQLAVVWTWKPRNVTVGSKDPRIELSCFSLYYDAVNNGMLAVDGGMRHK